MRYIEVLRKKLCSIRVLQKLPVVQPSTGGPTYSFYGTRKHRFMYPLQPLTGEDGAHVDVSASGFREGKHQKAFFDVKVFNPNAPSYHGTQV